MLTATITVPMLEITEIGLLTKKLNTSELLSNAGNYSNYYLFSIARWVQRSECSLGAMSFNINVRASPLT